MTPAQRVEAYIKLRDFKQKADEEFKKSLTRCNEAMQRLENELLQDLQTVGADSIACTAGTVYRRRELSASVEDRAKFLEFVSGEGGWDALDVKANKTFVKERIEAGEPVPGVKISQIDKVGVRRS